MFIQKNRTVQSLNSNINYLESKQHVCHYCAVAHLLCPTKKKEEIMH